VVNEFVSMTFSTSVEGRRTAREAQSRVTGSWVSWVMLWPETCAKMTLLPAFLLRKKEYFSMSEISGTG
jgi:hypothetical protein